MTQPEINIQYELNRLSETMRKYGIASGKSEAEVVEKQAGKLAWNIWSELRQIMPAKGAVRAERLAALRAGSGIKVSPAAYAAVANKYGALQIAEGVQRFKRGDRVVGSTTRGLNLQALAVQKELSLRESGRGFSAFGVPRPVRSYAGAVAQIDDTEYERQINSRYGYLLSEFHIDVRDGVEKKYASLKWTGRESVFALTKPQQSTLLNKAIRDLIADIQVYIERKQKEDILKFFGA